MPRYTVGTDLSGQNAQGIGEQIREMGEGAPRNPGEWVAALFRNPDVSNSQITRALTDAPAGSKDYKNQLRNVERWRDTATGRGKPENARKPSRESVDKLANSRSLRRLVGLLPKSVRVGGELEIIYTSDSTSQGTRSLDGVGIELTDEDLRDLLDAAGDDDELLGLATAQLVMDLYGDGVFSPERFTPGDDSYLTFTTNGR